MSNTNNNAAFVVEVAPVIAERTTRKFVASNGVYESTGSWQTRFVEEAKVWKTQAGAERWLAQRPEIAKEATIKPATMGRKFPKSA